MNGSFATTPQNRYFEDYIAGSVHEFGSMVVDEQEVIDFGKRFVPLSYHTDREAAKTSIYGGLIASGWHTAALMMRLLRSYIEVLNQKHEVVMSLKSVNFVRRRSNQSNP
jgi:acyl dehydratase